ncbi:SMI1/KNR4 family protein [Polyangium sorediatum]|uniref:SMI1/KNR4 family protein n=1 Tax=Polyangium sorediatum TaxID=889274 RepID=A0ABT6NT10_9BACT|nr:SMI1/KNR4 family protein [Polyangium sorediatum]MDI1431464.1 SMI1/KNR4 family protein [Polyangium sorediatum]
MTAPQNSDRPQRAAAATRRISAWLQKNVDADALDPPAEEASVQALANALGKPLPPELVAMWQVHDGLRIFEYEGLGPAASKKTRDGLESLRKKGTFDDHEVFEQSTPRVQPVKWHEAWIPIAKDSCGNLYCIDLAPGPAGLVGQVIKWEVAGGPFTTGSADLVTVLERYADALESGDFTYLVDSGIYDGPYLDLLGD